MISNLFNSKFKPHAILLIENKMCNVDQFITDFILSFVDKNDLTTINAIHNNSYLDLIKLDASESVKKQDTQYIINQFSMTSQEKNGNKFYVIKNVDRLNIQSSNSLLKFLEEPKANTYAILTTKVPHLVLNTIKSRCQSFIMKTDEYSFLNSLKSYNLNEQQIKLIKELYYDLDSIKLDLENKVFLKVYDLTQQLEKDIKNVFTIKAVLEQFKKLDYYQIELFLKITNFNINGNKILLNLIDEIKFMPPKVLIFNKICNVLENK
jgi:hypothetical protein